MPQRKNFPKRPYKGGALKKEPNRSAANSINRWLQTGSTAVQIAKTAAQVAKIVGLVNTEFKVLDELHNIQPGTTPVLTAPLNRCQQGSDNVNRVGDSCRFKSIEIKGRYLAASAARGAHVRFIVFIDKDANGAVPAFTDVLHNSGSGNYSYTPRNLDNRKRFIILKDMNLYVGALGSDRDIVPFEFYKKLDMHTIYDGNIGDVTDLSTNAIYVMYTTDLTVAPPYLTYTSRLRFLDN